MKTLPQCWSALKSVALAIAASLLLLTAAPLFADQTSGAPGAVMGVAFLMMFVVMAAGYIYGGLALQKIAQRTNVANAWWAWVPILQILLMLNIAKKPGWWTLLFFIPFVNFVIMIIVWMGIAEAVGKPNWWGILLLVPGVNLVVPGYLAWAE